jgi:hypothetical protein
MHIDKGMDRISSMSWDCRLLWTSLQWGQLGTQVRIRTICIAMHWTIWLSNSRQLRIATLRKERMWGTQITTI